jgi:hypothetical protein
VQLEIATPDVDDERDRRLERCDVREVLLRADADVRAALLCRFARSGITSGGGLVREIIRTGSFHLAQKAEKRSVNS